MVVLGLHDLEKPSKRDSIKFLLQDSPLHSVPLIKSSFYEGFQGSQEDLFGFHGKSMIS